MWRHGAQPPRTQAKTQQSRSPALRLFFPRALPGKQRLAAIIQTRARKLPGRQGGRESASLHTILSRHLRGRHRLLQGIHPFHHPRVRRFGARGRDRGGFSQARFPVFECVAGFGARDKTEIGGKLRRLNREHGRERWTFATFALSAQKTYWAPLVERGVRVIAHDDYDQNPT